jgi:hypothetical protein
MAPTLRKHLTSMRAPRPQSAAAPKRITTLLLRASTSRLPGLRRDGVSAPPDSNDDCFFGSAVDFDFNFALAALCDSFDAKSARRQCDLKASRCIRATRNFRSWGRAPDYGHERARQRTSACVYHLPRPQRTLRHNP